MWGKSLLVTKQCAPLTLCDITKDVQSVVSSSDTMALRALCENTGPINGPDVDSPTIVGGCRGERDIIGLQVRTKAPNGEIVGKKHLDPIRTLQWIGVLPSYLPVSPQPQNTDTNSPAETLDCPNYPAWEQGRPYDFGPCPSELIRLSLLSIGYSQNHGRNHCCRCSCLLSDKLPFPSFRLIQPMGVLLVGS